MYTHVCVSVYVINQVYGIILFVTGLHYLHFSYVLSASYYHYIFFLSNNLISLTWVLPPKHPLLSYLDSSSYLSHIQHHNPVSWHHHSLISTLLQLPTFISSLQSSLLPIPSSLSTLNSTISQSLPFIPTLP